MPTKIKNNDNVAVLCDPFVVVVVVVVVDHYILTRQAQKVQATTTVLVRSKRQSSHKQTPYCIRDHANHSLLDVLLGLGLGLSASQFRRPPPFGTAVFICVFILGHWHERQ